MFGLIRLCFVQRCGVAAFAIIRPK